MERLTKHNQDGTIVRNKANCPQYTCVLCPCIEECDRELFTRLAVLEDKLESGQLIEMPCKVGDTAYLVYSPTQIEPQSFVVENIELDIYGNTVLCHVSDKRKLYGGMYGEFRNNGRLLRFVGTDKAQAEARLKELQSK